MSVPVTLGSVSEVTCCEWSIPHFFRLMPEDSRLNFHFRSPTFPFSGSNWCLQLYPKGYIIGEWLSLLLYKEDSGDVHKNVTFTLGVKRSDGKLEEDVSLTHTFTKDGLNWGLEKFCKLNVLKARKSALVPADTLTITCRIEDNTPVGHPTEVAPRPSKLGGLETLSMNFSDLLSSKKKCDVTVRLKGVEFHAHKAVLVARSPVFAAMFEHDTSEEETGVVTVPDCDPDSFGDFLQYLYTGKFEGVSSRNAHHLYVTADKYDLQELKSICVACMTRNLSVENFFDIITLADQYDETELLSSAQTFFNGNVGEIFTTDEWMRLMRSDCPLANRFLLKMASKVKIQE